jgi:hypothetical protein
MHHARVLRNKNNRKVFVARHPKVSLFFAEIDFFFLSFLFHVLEFAQDLQQNVPDLSCSLLHFRQIFIAEPFLKLVSVEGIEPSLLGPKPRVIPFHHTEKTGAVTTIPT